MRNIRELFDKLRGLADSGRGFEKLDAVGGGARVRLLCPKAPTAQELGLALAMHQQVQWGNVEDGILREAVVGGVYASDPLHRVLFVGAILEGLGVEVLVQFEGQGAWPMGPFLDDLDAVMDPKPEPAPEVLVEPEALPEHPRAGVAAILHTEEPEAEPASEPVAVPGFMHVPGFIRGPKEVFNPLSMLGNKRVPLFVSPEVMSA